MDAGIDRAESLAHVHARRIGAIWVATLLLVGAVGVWRAVNGSSDFDGFHQWVVEMWRVREIPHETRRYPPSFLAILSPLGALPLELAATTWMLANLLALLRLPTTFERLTGVPRREQWPAWLALTPLVVDNLLLAQSGPLLLWIVSEGLWLARQRRAFFAGVLLATATGIKLLPGAFWAVLAARRRGATALPGALLTGTLAVGVLVVIVGPAETAHGWARWWSELRSSHATPQAMIETGSALRFNNQALPIVLARTLSHLEPQPRGAVELAGLPVPTVLWIYRAIVAGLVLVGLACAWRIRNDDERSWGELYALVAIGILISVPLVWTHYFLWVAPALIVLCRRWALVLLWGLLFALLLTSRSCRGLGAHMLLAIGLYGIVALQVARRARAAPAAA